MSVRIYGNKLKFCRLYEDDVFGILNLRPKNNHKVLDVIYKDIMKKDLFYKSLSKKLFFFHLKLKKFFYIHYNRYFEKLNLFIKKSNVFYFENIKVFLKNFFNFFNKKEINIKIFLYLIKQLRNKGIFIGNKIITKKSIIGRFNFRVDEGKPKREKKKVTLYGTRLLTRHRLRFFASRMTVRQFRSYLKKKRGSKYLGMLFIWLLETRIDTIFYRLNFQASSLESRQYIKHFGVLINDVFINIHSYRMGFYDYLSLNDKKQMFKFVLFKFFKHLIFMSIPFYYEVNYRIMTFTFFFKPHQKMIFFPFSIDVQRLSGLGERF